MSVEGGVEAEVGPKPKQSTRECVSQEEEGNSILQVWQIPFKLCTLGVIVDLEANTSRDGLPLWFSGKESACNTGDADSIPGSGRSPGKRNDNPLWCSCLGNPMDRGAWQATVHGVTKELDVT